MDCCVLYRLNSIFDRRQQVSDKFLEQIKEVSNKLEQHSAARNASIEENDRLRSELKSVLERYQSR